ncbi:FecR domain-containing protein [Pyxidicoccus parkwayensis]|uniref:FecR domain-containing protein n=1 Tax=Pyxidicoccus parkwayensis TaxID=2813578 RepID=A0ABX7P0B5_9BACT|nr:FecR domain-containing protein [Pyxidicoccus parkwaysis]QSQ23167.1 FecR domain-containing protein [Pyxidicoccus parkwaysis]
MTPRKKTSGELLRAWSKAPLPEAPATDDLRRARVTAAMRAAVSAAQAAQARQRRWRLAAVAAVLLVLVPLGGLLALRASRAPGPPRLLSVSGNVFVVRAGQARPAETGTRLSLADEVGTLDGAGARLEIPGTSTVDLAPSTRLSLVSQGVRLTAGEVYVYVSPLGSQRSFQVETPHATAVVHGTSFLVSVKPMGDSTRSTVAVREGLVVVHWHGGEVMLGPGQSWTSAEEPTAPASTPPPTEEPAAPAPKPPPIEEPTPTPPPRAPPGGRPASKSPPHGRPPPPPPPPDSEREASAISQLALQNQLYQQGLAARRRGDEAEAVRFFSELLERFPDSALADEARQQRTQALEKQQEPPAP